jgi:hypothetical protein
MDASTEHPSTVKNGETAVDACAVLIRLRPAFLADLRAAAHLAGMSAAAFLLEMVESELASRRLSCLPLAAEPEPRIRRRSGVQWDDFSGPLNTHCLHLPNGHH